MRKGCEARTSISRLSRAHVEYDPRATGAARLIETVKEIGYGASNAEEEGGGFYNLSRCKLARVTMFMLN